MSACWLVDPEKQPEFSILKQHLGELLEEEKHSEYIIFSATNLLPSWHMESRSKSSFQESQKAITRLLVSIL